MLTTPGRYHGYMHRLVCMIEVSRQSSILSLGCLPQMIRDARLRTEIIDNRGRIPRYGLLRHSFEEILQLSKVLALAWSSALDELLPRFGI